MRVVRGEFLFIIRRAAFAQTRRRVPTNIGTDPFAAASTLMKVRLGLFDRDGEGVVVSFTAYGTLDFVGAGPGAAQNSSEDVPSRAEHIRNYPGRVWLKPGLITIAAFVAAETKLKPSVGRKVIEIGCKLNERHVKCSFGKTNGYNE